MDINTQAIYWRNYSEAELAAYQQDQGREPFCAKYSGASAINMLFGSDVHGEDIIKFANGHYSIPFNSGTTMRQIRRLLGRYGGEIGIYPTFKYERDASVLKLKDHLKNPNQIILLSVGWLGSKAPRPLIYRGNGNQPRWIPKGFLGGHVVALVAYDPMHTNKNGDPTQWGMLSSWVNGGRVIHWMEHQNFLATVGGLRNWNPVLLVGKGDEISSYEANIKE